MLVLMRGRGEEIVINHDTVVTIVAIKGDKVRVGITAPKDVTVHRREVEDAINADSTRANGKTAAHLGLHPGPH